MSVTTKPIELPGPYDAPDTPGRAPTVSSRTTPVTLDVCANAFAEIASQTTQAIAHRITIITSLRDRHATCHRLRPIRRVSVVRTRRLATAGLVPSSAIDQQPRYWNEPVAGSAGCAHAGPLHRSATATKSARLIRERIEITFHEWVLDGASLSGAHTPSDDNDAERIRTRSPVRTECGAPRRRRWHGRSADPSEPGNGCSRPPNTRISASSSNSTTRTRIASSVPLPIP